MSAPIGAKHCSYQSEYMVEWYALYRGLEPGQVAVYEKLQPERPVGCAAGSDLHSAPPCYYADILKPGERPPASYVWVPRSVQIQWRKVQE
jgi:hypothetical protein